MRTDADGSEPTRRDFLTVTAGAWAGIGAAVTLWPLVEQMAPDATTRAQATLEVDLGTIAPGQSVTVMWRGKPVFVRRRMPAEVEAARAVPADALIDRHARAAGLADSSPASDANRVKAGREEWLIVVGVCTHLGCVPQGQGRNERRGSFGGWFCSCHGSEYDVSGRVRRGPADKNLAVPPYWFAAETRIELGRLAKDGPVV